MLHKAGLLTMSPKAGPRNACIVPSSCTAAVRVALLALPRPSLAQSMRALTWNAGSKKSATAVLTQTNVSVSTCAGTSTHVVVSANTHIRLCVPTSDTSAQHCRNCSPTTANVPLGSCVRQPSCRAKMPPAVAQQLLLLPASWSTRAPSV